MRARAALDGGNIATVSPGKPHARELHNVFPRWQRFHFGANPTSARATPQVRGCRFFRHDNEPDKKDRHGEDVA